MSQAEVVVTSIFATSVFWVVLGIIFSYMGRFQEWYTLHFGNEVEKVAMEQQLEIPSRATLIMRNTR